MDDAFAIKRSGDFQSVEMPGEIVAINNCDGRTIVTLAGGRIVDITDWFSASGTCQ